MYSIGQVSISLFHRSHIVHIHTGHTPAEYGCMLQASISDDE